MQSILIATLSLLALTSASPTSRLATRDYQTVTVQAGDTFSGKNGNANLIVGGPGIDFGVAFGNTELLAADGTLSVRTLQLVGNFEGIEVTVTKDSTGAIVAQVIDPGMDFDNFSPDKSLNWAKGFTIVANEVSY